MSKTCVSIVGCASYDRDQVRKAVGQAIDLIGGPQRFLKTESGSNVLLKPNLVAPLSRERRATTDPEVVRAVAEIFKQAGAGEISIGDSPAVASAAMAMRRGGYSDILPDFVRQVPFKIGRKSPTTGHADLELAEVALDAPTLVNLPKLKTHAYTGMTAAVKNLFGTVIGARKAQWHLRAGKNRQLFARLIAQICYALKPALTVVDAVIAMEGNGPSNGNGREVQLIIAGEDPAAVDTVCASLLGYGPGDLPIAEQCAELGLGTVNLEDIEIYGEDLPSVAIANWQRAVIPEGQIGIGSDGIIAAFFRRALTSRPQILKQACKLCGNCAEICPPDAITMNASEKQYPQIDFSKCIRCFCCQEACPHQAITVKPGWLLRLLSICRLR
jgi:uncharacterized protein (DUF362 family)/Pyruvate/2-oxoacid:ferredoxin oxidoreductase delta subunit